MRHATRHCGGTTSACAENTRNRAPTPPQHWNYLRVRGEYQALGFLNLHSPGTTSACAENTCPSTLMQCLLGNYLRVRGEYDQVPTLCASKSELPPRARRIPSRPSISRVKVGTTSACAENTIEAGHVPQVTWNYLRVRGEYGGWFT